VGFSRLYLEKPTVDIKILNKNPNSLFKHIHLGFD